VTTGEAQAIHDRLDKQDEKLDKIMQAVTRQVAVCEPTRTRMAAVCDTVYGNGQNGLKNRVTALETVREIRGKGFWALVALVSSIVSGAVLAVGGAVVAAMKG